MILLTYTEEMEKQDRMYLEEAENKEIMEGLFVDIEEEAKSKGFKGEVIIREVGGSLEAEVKDEGEEEGTKVPSCKYLVEELEFMLNGV